MYKLGLTVLFAIAAACVRTVNRDANNRRDIGLMSLTKALYKEDKQQCFAVMLQLAKDFGEQEKTQECLQAAIEESIDLFGTAAGMALMAEMKEHSHSVRLNAKLDAVLHKRINHLYSERCARDETVKYLSRLMFTNGWRQPDFDVGNIDGKRKKETGVIDRMNPDQFLARYRLVTVKLPPEALSQP